MNHWIKLLMSTTSVWSFHSTNSFTLWWNLSTTICIGFKLKSSLYGGNRFIELRHTHVITIGASLIRSLWGGGRQRRSSCIYLTVRDKNYEASAYWSNPDDLEQILERFIFFIKPWTVQYLYSGQNDSENDRRRAWNPKTNCFFFYWVH